jgi:hypothetical protein
MQENLNKTFGMAKSGGAGSFCLSVIYLLFSIQTGITDLNEAVADNSSRLNVVEYRLNDKG